MTLKPLLPELKQGRMEEKETLKKRSPIHPAGLLPEVQCSNFSNLLGAPSLPLSLSPSPSQTYFQLSV
ncbi:hypothetical protein Q8A67_010094 [Cirrhinus molitorella]|uniref:Uncharacterized protein n=1 Tax=Cirrhinus molitorella TaxID=172907 RepID=A0AA88PWN3_9TELE|nr:hypothetical protein Q8A67_010094 [Cirrhinus molitorella]